MESFRRFWISCSLSRSRQGVEELDQEKLGSLLELKYHSVPDAIDQLGEVPVIRDTFVGFQQYLYD